MQNFIKRVITRVLKTERFQKWIAAWVVLLLLAFVAVSLYREFRKTEEIELLQMEERKPPQAFFHLGDSLGSSQVVVDGSGLVVQVNSYSPYGEILSEPHKEQSIDHLYTGQELDRSTGLYNYGARAYDSATSRFLSVDRVHQSPSPYTYSGNSPVQYLDPDGNSYKESDGSSLQPIMTADLRTIDIGSIKRLHPWDPTVDLKTLPPHVELRAISHSNGSKTYFLRERPMVIMDPDISVRFFGRSLQREKPSPEKTKLPEEFVVFVKGFLEEEIQEQGRGPTEFISWNLFNDK
ncbi:MAG: RHS repeat-associated core domain-containing protein, partial [Deltaproteobacteria bacterium]|nr:RHS repeat-associated core domain-containing protein [Deltaproteobacteria bacterium]